eukprot:scpid84094/ scgid10724/ 
MAPHKLAVGRYTKYYRHSGYKALPRWVGRRLGRRPRHPLGISKHWQSYYQHDPQDYEPSYGLSKSLFAANARLVKGLPERFLATSQLYPVEAVEDDIRHSIWQISNHVNEPIVFEHLDKRQLFLQYLFPTVFQHLYRLPRTDFSRTNHVAFNQHISCFFSRWGQNQMIKTETGLLMRNSVPVKPYAIGDQEISSVLSSAYKPTMDFSPRGDSGMRFMHKESCNYLRPRGGFLEGTNKFGTTKCERRYSNGHFMHDQIHKFHSPGKTLSTGILYMFGQLHAQAYVRDRVNITHRFRPVLPASGPHERGIKLAIPEVCHGVVTNGQTFQFLIFQLNTTAPEFDSFENIVWASESMKLFEDLETESAGPQLNLDCLRMLACILNYDPRLYWPLYAEETEDFLSSMRSANKAIGRSVRTAVL